MKIVVIAKQAGKRKIDWANYFLLSFCLAMIMGLGVGGVYYLLAGRWSHAAVTYGIGIGAGIVGFGFIMGLQTPIDKLGQHVSNCDKPNM